MTTQAGEQVPFVEELLRQLHATVSDLETHQVHTFYEAVATMLSDKGQQGIEHNKLLEKLMVRDD